MDTTRHTCFRRTFYKYKTYSGLKGMEVILLFYYIPRVEIDWLFRLHNIYYLLLFRCSGLTGCFTYITFIIFYCSGVQALQERVQHLQLNTMRFVASIVFVAVMLLIKFKFPRISSMDDFKVLVIYCVNCNVSVLAMYVPVVYIPLVTFEAIYIASNILSSFIIFGIILWNKSEWVQVRLCPCFRKECVSLSISNCPWPNLIQPHI